MTESRRFPRFPPAWKDRGPGSEPVSDRAALKGAARHDARYILVSWRIDEVERVEGTSRDGEPIRSISSTPGHSRASIHDLTRREAEAAWKAAWGAVDALRVKRRLPKRTSPTRRRGGS